MIKRINIEEEVLVAGDFNETHDTVKEQYKDMGLIPVRNLGGTRKDPKTLKWSDIDHFLYSKQIEASIRL